MLGWQANHQLDRVSRQYSPAMTTKCRRADDFTAFEGLCASRQPCARCTTASTTSIGRVRR
eukprot:6756836-Alexandrium_andersonii.AAC.1